MASVNKIILIGHLGKDPEVRTFPSGDRVAAVTMATTATWKDKQSGERREATEWHRVVFRGGLAGIVEQYLRKGAQIYVEGSIRTRKYNDREGIERSIAEVHASEMTMLNTRQGNGQDDGQGRNPPARSPAPAPQGNGRRAAPPPQRTAAPAPQASSGFDDMDDDIPF